MFAGLFGSGANRLKFTPGIMPEEGEQGGNPFAQQAAPKMTFGDKVGIFGGMLQDMDWTMGKGNADRARANVQDNLSRAQAEQEKQRKLALIKQATQGQNPQLQAAAMLNPEAYSSRAISNQMLNPLDVNADRRAQEGLDLTRQGQEFGQNMETQKFEYGQQRDGVMDERYADELGYNRGQDAKMWDYRDKTFDRGVFESDRGFGLQQQAAASQRQRAPQLVELYDEQTGQPYKAAYNPMTGGFDRVGGVKSGKEKTFNQAQSQAAGFASRAGAANETISAITADGYNHGAARFWPTRGDNQRKYEAAADEFINAALRNESGAAISDKERDQAYKMYFPQYGDDPSVVKQKAAARERVIQSMRAESQGAYESMYGSGREQYGANQDWSRYQPLPGMGMEELPDGYLQWLANQ